MEGKKHSNHSLGKNSPKTEEKLMPQCTAVGPTSTGPPSASETSEHSLHSCIWVLILQPRTETLPDRSCFILPLLALGSTGKKSLNQVISGSGFPLAAQSIVAVRVRSTTFSWGPMSMLGNPGGNWSSGGREQMKSGYTHSRDTAAEIQWKTLRKPPGRRTAQYPEQHNLKEGNCKWSMDDSWKHIMQQNFLTCPLRLTIRTSHRKILQLTMMNYSKKLWGMATATSKLLQVSHRVPLLGR